MKVKQLLEYIKNNNIPEDAELLVIGNGCYYGTDVISFIKDKMSELKGNDIISEHNDALGIITEKDIYEHGDLGQCNLWVDDNGLEYFKNNVQEQVTIIARYKCNNCGNYYEIPGKRSSKAPCPICSAMNDKVGTITEYEDCSITYEPNEDLL